MRYDRKSFEKSDTRNSDDYKCSSFGYTNKPTIIECMKCGLSQIPQSEIPADLSIFYKDVIDDEYLSNIHIKVKTFNQVYTRIKKYISSTSRF